MEINIVRLHFVSGHTFDADTAYMLDIGVMPTDSFDAQGEGALAVKEMVSKRLSLDSTEHQGRRTVILVDKPDSVIAYEEMERP